MKRKAAWLWLALVLAALLHVGLTAWRGMPLDSDLMALLPAEELDPGVLQAEHAIDAALSRRIVVLFGGADPAVAKQAAAALEARLRSAGLLTPGSDVPDPDQLQKVGALYFPARAGLLAEDDRQALIEGRGEDLLNRTLAQIFGFSGVADGRLLTRDPFLLFPSFLAGLPLPSGSVHLEDGRIMVADKGLIWAGVTGTLAGEPTSLSFQKRFAEAFGKPDISTLRLGAVFFASAGTAKALKLSSAIGLVSLLGTALLLIVAFRSARPLLLGLLSVAVGLVVALSVCLLAFGTLHVAAQLFGASLIGIAADYSLLYFAQIWSPAAPGEPRLRRVLAGITLGMATTVIGYLTLSLSPFPGLHQVALFSAAGLIAAYVTVLLWFPPLDCMEAKPMGPVGLALARAAGALWGSRTSMVLGAAALVLALVGYSRLQADDDVRHQQALDAELSVQQAEVQRLLGFSPSGQFFLVEGGDDEEALQREEALTDRLRQAGPILTGWTAPSGFVPSRQRQAANRALVEEKLTKPYLPALAAKLGMPAPVESSVSEIDLAAMKDAVPLLPSLLVAPGRHLVLTQGVRDLAALHKLAEGLPGVRFVDPVGDVSDVLAAYRKRAVLLLAVSALLMAPLVVWRYGWRGLAPVLGPPLGAILLTPALLALVGLPFTFFSALGLVLALSIGVDYAVFCAEDGRLAPVTLAGITLAMTTAVLSFGLLAVSEMEGMRTFGATMLVAVPLAWVMAPLAARAKRRS